MLASSSGRVHVSITAWCGFSCAPPLLPEPRFEKRRHIRASVRVHLTTTPLGSCWRKPCAWSPDHVQTLADCFTPLGPLQRCCQAWDLYFASAFFFSSLSSWHLPKVLILQSASARAGADRTFSDQYLGQVRGGEQMTEEGTVPRTGASGLLVLLVAGRSPRMVHCAWKR